MDAKYIEMAIRRYEAMAGLLHAVPEGLLRRAETDRAAFGAIYLYPHFPSKALISLS